MTIGDTVRLIGIPSGLPDKGQFEKCIGKEFAITNENEYGNVALGVESATGVFADTLWIETKYIEAA